MRPLFLIFTMTIAALCGVAQTAAQWLDPRIVAEGKEPARSLVRSYNTAQSALQPDAQSLYMQPLNDEWKITHSGAEITCERNFKMPFAWVDRHVMLHLDAVDGAFEVFVNGQKAGYSQSSSTPSEFDIAHLVVEGRNTLKITVHKDHAGNKIENYKTLSTGTLGSDNYVISQPKVRVRDFVTDTRVEAGHGLFSLGVIVKSHLLNNKELKVYYDLLSPQGKSVANGHRDAQFNMRGEDTVRFFANIDKIKAWSHEEPNLYTLTIKTQHEGRFKEYLSFKVGFRSVDMNGGELLINGKPIMLSIAEYEGADSLSTMREELTTLKNSGANCIKVKSHPLAWDFYDLCDQLGLYVCDQAAVNSHLSGESRGKGGNLSNDPLWEQSYTDRAQRMYYNSKNHPCVVMFSIADNSANGYNLYQSYLSLKSLENSRPIIYLGSGGEWNSDAERKVSFDPTQKYHKADFTPITITDVDAGKGLFRVANNYKIKTLDNAKVEYLIKNGKRVLAKGEVAVNVAAENSTEVKIPMLKIKPGTKLTITLSVQELIVPKSYVPEIVDEELKPTQSKLAAGLATITAFAKAKLSEPELPQETTLAQRDFETVFSGVLTK